MLSKNERFAAYTQTNFQGLQAQLAPGKWYESPEAMNFPNDRMQSLRKEWDDQSDLALRLHFLPKKKFTAKGWHFYFFMKKKIFLGEMDVISPYGCV